MHSWHCSRIARWRVHFKKGKSILREGEFANRFYLIETGKVVLESSAGFGKPMIIDTIWRRGLARMVMDVSAIRMAIHCAGA